MQYPARPQYRLHHLAVLSALDGAGMDALLTTIDRTLGDLSFWIGLVVVFIFARERFGRSEADVDELDLPVPVRSFTTRFRYNFAAFVYGGLYSLTYVALLLLSAFPQAQKIVKQWFGAVGVDDKLQIATPIGAAMVAMSVIPSIPFARNWDIGVRATLREFASIPFKARYIADLVADRLAREAGLAKAFGRDPDVPLQVLAEKKLLLHEKIRDRIRQIQRSNRLRAARQYALYFAKHRSIDEGVGDAIAAIRNDIETRADYSGFMIDQIDLMNRKLARYLVSALLVVEADEYSALRVIADELKIADVPTSVWRFKSSQIVLGMINVLIASAVGSLTAAIVMVLLSNDAIDVTFLRLFFEIGMGLSIALVPLFLTPLVFAAGAEMYIIDRKTFGDVMEWDERALSAILTFVGCLTSALIVTTIFGVIAAHFYQKSVELGQILPWSLPPAAVAMAFFVTSRTRSSWNRTKNAVADFVIHMLVATVAALIAQRLSLAAGLSYQGDAILDTLIYLLTEPLPMLTVVGLIGGSLGAVQCAVSRDVMAGS